MRCGRKVCPVHSLFTMSISLVRLASLDLVRGFVAVGRRMSMSHAAEDLCLSQSAISKQIKALEDYLGVRLLVRGHRTISFTPEGERLFQSANSAVLQLQDAFAAVLSAGAQRPVTVTASIGVAGLWLLPRLGRFQQQHPDIDVRVAANNAVLNLRAEDIDLSIRYCLASVAPAGATRLFGETIRPVASPALGVDSLTAQSNIADHFLLEFDDSRRPWLQWNAWLSALGWQGSRPKGILRFNQYDQVIQAALAGQGIALGRLELLAPALAEKHLVALAVPDGAPDSKLSYWLVTAETSPSAAVTQVARWIQAESTAMQQMF